MTYHYIVICINCYIVGLIVILLSLRHIKQSLYHRFNKQIFNIQLLLFTGKYTYKKFFFLYLFEINILSIEKINTSLIITI